MTDHTPRPPCSPRPKRSSRRCPICSVMPGKTFVVKYGGHAMGDPEAAARFRRGCRAAEGGRHQSGGRAWRRAADRRDAQAARRRIALRRRPARDRCRDRARSPKWCWRARSTRKSSAGSARRAAARSAFRARMPASSPPKRSSATQAGPNCRGSNGMSIWASSASRSRSIAAIIDTLSAAGIIPVIAPIAIGADGAHLQHQRRYDGGRDRRRARRVALLPADRRRRRARQDRANCSPISIPRGSPSCAPTARSPAA